ncbi:YqaJ viral recombinase family protein [Tepidibacillus fermentans]|uniref:Putative phage-type endonuclease n=1 Tax=Tepidibacillus fermentans TaxID=1281767 RepID=A0A4R3KBF9_9BACI|nr:YqaJ viral recombinase family protein [Tepidibacillus fermentans]TCS80355.1 putative phage-type endonuclease [Tepidibacillus fermentans]
MNASVLAMTNEMSREEWLKARRNGIGGSDAAAIAGLNKWKSPVAVYLEKTGMVEVEEVFSEAAYFGTLLEDVVAQEFSKRTGLKVRRKNAILQHPEYPFMIANVDRLIVGENAGLECKTASEYLKDEWKDDDIPASYLIQCQHYMAVTGFDSWWIAVLIGGNKFIYKKIERDEEIIQYLINIEKDFWDNHVVKRIPPMFDGSKASSDLLKALYPEAEHDSEIELDSEADTLITALEQVNEELKQLEEKKAEYENRIKAKLGDFERGIASNHIVTWKTINSSKFDSTRFKKEHPDLYKQYVKESSYRRFSIKREA